MNLLQDRALVVATTILVGLVFVACGRVKDEPTPTSVPSLANQVAATPAVSKTPTSSSTTAPSVTPLPTATSVPPTAVVPTPTVEPTATPIPPAPLPRRLPHEPPERDLYALAQRLGGVGQDSPRRVVDVRTDYEAGHRQEFFVTDLKSDTTHAIHATLQVVSANAYWYVDDTLDLTIEDLQSAANEYESGIRPTMLEALGDVWNPGVDGDPRLTVLHTPLGGNVAGYFDSQNEFPRRTHPNSNEREMLFMDGTLFDPGSSEYLGVLSHELQHAVHWAHDQGEDSWVNEGMSEVAKELAGYSPSFIDSFLGKPSTQLTFWEGGSDSPPHYGAATLFILYLAEHYGGADGLQRLIDGAGDGVEGMNAYFEPHSTTFDEVYTDWIIANYLDSATGPYSYSERQVQVRRIDRVSEFGETTGFLAPYSARYFDLRLPPGDVVLEFQGDTTTQQVATKCHSGDSCWWGNRGDSIDAMLTREFDLTNLSKATLEFWTWFDIEENWDYAYVEVSPDGGETWTILQGTNTTDDNPVGNSYGHGFTGASDGWVHEPLDLTPYVGGKVLVRFEYITDDAVYEDGFVIDDIAVQELDFFDDGDADQGWDAQGFERIDNVVPVEWVVQIIERHSDGTDTVRRIEFEVGMSSSLSIAGLGSGISTAVVVVSPMSPDTHHLSQFTLGAFERGSRSSYSSSKVR